MDNCRKYKKIIHEYLNKERSDQIKKELDTHLLECISCKEYFDSMLILNNSLKRLKKDYTIDVKDAVMKEIEKQQSKPAINRKVYLRYAAAFACMVVVVGVYIMTGGFHNIQRDKNYNDTNKELSEVQNEETVFGITTAFDSENQDRSVLSPGYKMNQEDLSTYNYITDKNYDEIIGDITSVSDEFLILDVCTVTEKNELSFISYNIDTEKIAEKLNLKKDSNYKTDESASDNNEYVKLIIIYSD